MWSEEAVVPVRWHLILITYQLLEGKGRKTSGDPRYAQPGHIRKLHPGIGILQS